MASEVMHQTTSDTGTLYQDVTFCPMRFAGKIVEYELTALTKGDYRPA